MMENSKQQHSQYQNLLTLKNFWLLFTQFTPTNTEQVMNHPFVCIKDVTSDM